MRAPAAAPYDGEAAPGGGALSPGELEIERAASADRRAARLLPPVAALSGPRRPVYLQVRLGLHGRRWWFRETGDGELERVTGTEERALCESDPLSRPP